MRLAVLACFSLSLLCGQTWGPGPGSQPDYSLIYTGRLFGYFRYSDLQTSSDRGCPDAQSPPLSPQVKLFRATLAEARSSRQKLVAMGENFAPDLLARAVVNKSAGTPHFGEMLNKDVVSAGADHVLSDNVGCFLRLMHFDATVPGQQDFYYGPERLRQIARFLASPGDGQYKPVQMLAANLVISSVVRSPNPRKGNEALAPEVRRALEAASPVQFDLPSTVLPWLKQVALKGGEQGGRGL